jgi:hypothetical protein
MFRGTCVKNEGKPETLRESRRNAAQERRDTFALEPGLSMPRLREPQPPGPLAEGEDGKRTFQNEAVERRADGSLQRPAAFLSNG